MPVQEKISLSPYTQFLSAYQPKTTQNIKISRLEKQHAAAYKSLRIKALKTDPEAFLLTKEEETKLQLDDICHMIEKDYILGAFENSKLVGAIRLIEQDPLKFKHIGIVGGLYVDFAHRQKGIAKMLVKGVIEYATYIKKYHALQLKVVTKNLAAIRLYQSFQFQCWATEKNALQFNGECTDQHHFSLVLSASMQQ